MYGKNITEQFVKADESLFTLLYLTIIIYCITSCQLSKAIDTNLGLDLTVST